MLDIGQKHIDDYYMPSLAPWAGKEIVSISDHAGYEDYPPYLFTPDEIRDLMDRTSPNGHAITLSSLCSDHFRNGAMVRAQRASFDPLQLWDQFRTREKRFYATWDAVRRFKDFESAADYVNQVKSIVEPKLFYPNNQPWILRNLTTKGFVRAEAVALRPEYINGPHIAHRGFGHVIMSRIFWSSTPCIDDGFAAYKGKDTHRGVWAGHRFDIITEKQHLESKMEKDE
ncbi:hypothetical protein EJ08DRAFT_164729 [Tothia fuscella]|uniref:Uncharacterized protein n=1 Tax=Tothia fuscella TaxID=1048955 RepID=A0A9P4NTD0_9PEZI|nr:hypothetical protein EJ08DRAFT_164729 [Tothia fuscella]